MTDRGRGGLNSEDRNTLQAFLRDIKKDYPYFIGFPGSTDFEYESMYPFFSYLLNNVGDPLEAPLHANHSKRLEVEVIDFFADLFRAPKNDRWGYITSGGTESNLYALYIGRSLYPNAKVFYSESAHYSIPKNIHILAMDGVQIAAQENGEMDYADLRKNLKQAADCPVIVVATIGTTMTEAKDNLYIIRRILAESAVSDTYIHCDAALAGPYTALLEPHHPFDFKDGADSISVSGHKFIGCPMACGVVVTKKSYRNKIIRDSLYVGASDTTIGGSRNGHIPIMLWYRIKTLGIDGLKRRAIQGIELAEYLRAELQVLAWPCWYSHNSLTVVIKTPPADVVHKWQLATYDGKSHIICMPGVTKKKIDDFLVDLRNCVPTKK